MFIYDLADYDAKYINRSSIVLDKNNLNSRYSKKFYYHYEKFINKLNFQFIWKIETDKKRKSLKKKKKLKQKIKNIQIVNLFMILLIILKIGREAMEIIPQQDFLF